MPLDITGQGSIDGITSLNNIISHNELAHLDGLSLNVQNNISSLDSAINTKADSDNATLTGTTSIQNLTRTGTTTVDTSTGFNITTKKDFIAAGSSSTTKNVLRQTADHANWTYGSIILEMWTIYYNSATWDYGLFVLEYGYGGGASVTTKISGNSTLAWTGSTQISGNIYRRDLQITMPAYTRNILTTHTVMATTENINETAQWRVYYYNEQV